MSLVIFYYRLSCVPYDKTKLFPLQASPDTAAMKKDINTVAEVRVMKKLSLPGRVETQHPEDYTHAHCTAQCVKCGSVV